MTSSHTPEQVAERSNRAEVRNPVLALPSGRRLAMLSPLARAELRGVVIDIRADALTRAEQCWRKHKAPMAAYWKAVAVYSGHIARILK
ncbi:hypothetical protein [Allosphingosinicella indica]|uniref:Uncharacterized protein n=1 Tax=Allosphingosinicella indica TaxID=941907 RepID=A0A1X7GKY9_9SPHN|nr:hypothetical protein [Allosphingosinicella indica]SMF70623.1 hypothetical protein SAMN06295910_1910 [Allosphingosinicella indica]